VAFEVPFDEPAWFFEDALAVSTTGLKSASGMMSV
jgi:hypothetical protein